MTGSLNGGVSAPLGVREIVFRRESLKRSIRVSLIVGTILVVVNHMEVLLSGVFTPVWWVKVALTYFVPFLVCNYGMVTARRMDRPK